MASLYEEMLDHQIKWRRDHLPQIKEWGWQNQTQYEHLLPHDKWEASLWEDIPKVSGESVRAYLEREKKSPHSGTHNLLSSWVLCANLYFPFRSNHGRAILAGFLREKLSRELQSLENIELEFASERLELRPPQLLGETLGTHTSPDIGFHLKTATGKALVLTECKFTEHNFYGCWGHPSTRGSDKKQPDSCKRIPEIFLSPTEHCNVSKQGKKYWNILGQYVNAEEFMSLKVCVAAHGGFQLFRQQALAEGIARSGDFEWVVSAVAYDARNKGLMSCMARSTGVTDVRNDWGSLFKGQAGFVTFTHQAWVDWVSKHNGTGMWSDWLGYIKNRYSL